MSYTPVIRDWPADRAILIVHGIGNTQTGGGEEIEAAVRAALGPDADSIAIYQLYYDGINDWFAGKTQAAALISKLVGKFRQSEQNQALADTLADYAGDVLWPVMSVSARVAVRSAYIAQLQQVVNDGVRCGHAPAQQRLTIITHSLGCFHTYEALHEISRQSSYKLQPGTHHVRFENVISMASPVQLIRSVAGAMGAAVPDRTTLTTLSDAGLSLPEQKRLDGVVVPSAKRWISIAGDLDPVGGYALRKRLAWAYADIPGQLSLIDQESAVTIANGDDLRTALHASLRTGKAPAIAPNDPHSWTAYVGRHADDIKGWVA
ncbi:MAG: hypothetical protein O2973_03285 [Gemmatimonadetes bacterium]|nr:hypothetical protein [Gemmatimonadota bacterium]